MTGFTGHSPFQFITGERGFRQTNVAVSPGRVLIDYVEFSPAELRFLAQMAEGATEHLMSECYWVDCPEHSCEFTMSHTRNWCGRPTCREA